MNCGDIISFDALLRRVVRFNASDPYCAAIKVVEGSFDGGVTCEPDAVLTQYALAVVNDAVRISYGQGGNPFEFLECPNPPSLTELALSVIGESEFTTGTLIQTRENDPTLSLGCGQDCDDDEPISTLEQVMRSFLKTDFNTPYSVQVTTVNYSTPMDCDIEYSFDALIRMVLAPVGDGSYAWRITA